jgi:hypothetical protein
MWGIPWGMGGCGSFRGIWVDVGHSIGHGWMWVIPWDMVGCGSFRGIWVDVRHSVGYGWMLVIPWDMGGRASFRGIWVNVGIVGTCLDIAHCKSVLFVFTYPFYAVMAK